MKMTWTFWQMNLLMMTLSLFTACDQGAKAPEVESGVSEVVKTAAPATTEVSDTSEATDGQPVFGMPDKYAVKGDWPMWGGSFAKNMSSAEVIPDTFHAGDLDYDTSKISLKWKNDDGEEQTAKNVKWVAKLGSQAYGNTVVSQGKVLIGTNNDAPYHKRFKDDRSLLMCLDEKTGEFIWQLTIPKLGAGKVSDWEFLGLCSSPAVDGDKVYIASNLCEIVCVDLNGMSNGNQGMQGEGAYMAGEGKEPVEVTEKDADILWTFDMRELGVFPHNITSSSVLVVGDVVYATTSNGKDWSHTNTPSPNAPCLIALDKNTGELLGEEFSEISIRLLHANWSSPAWADVDGKQMVIFGGGDGYCYAFDPKPYFDKDEELNFFKELWRVDCNPEAYRIDPETKKPRLYAKGGTGPSEIIATPIVVEDRIYVPVGQDPEHGPGWGNLVCINAKDGKIIWQSQKVGRTISTCAVVDGHVYAAEYGGRVFCFDAASGDLIWEHDLLSYIWASPLAVNGKLVIGNEDHMLVYFDLAAMKAMAATYGNGFKSSVNDDTLIIEDAKGKEHEIKLAGGKPVHEVEMHDPIYSSAIAANGVLYVATQQHLYAIGK